MKTIKNITASQQDDKQKALLALAASEDESGGNCLSPEEMAQLVDHGFAPKTKEKFQLHLQACETCYQEWITLTMITQETSPSLKADKITYLFKNPKGLTFIGSTLAAAASLILFLNIQNDLSLQGESMPSVSAPIESKKDHKSPIPPPSIQPAPMESEVAEPPLPASSKEVHKEKDNNDLKRSDKALKRAAPQPPVNVNEAEKPSAAAAAPAKSRAKRKKLFETVPQTSFMESTGNTFEKAEEQREIEPQTEDYSTEVIVTDFDRWLNEIKRECHQNTFKKEFWTNSQHQGKIFLKTLQNSTSTTTQEYVTVISTLIDITSSLTEQNMRPQCMKIIGLLEEEVRNR